jgi:acyl dehydratase
MAINYERLKDWAIPSVEVEYGLKETMLYALSLGLGANPIDADQLRFVYEKQLQALPTMAFALGYSGFWLQDPATGVDWKQTLHGEQSLEVYAPLPISGKVIGRTWVEEILDKGSQKGAVVYSRHSLTDQTTGQLLCNLSSTLFCRGDGGFGGPSGPSKEAHRLPERTADVVCELPTLPNAALLYRLNGDFNPLHADPEIAAQSGFGRPILHGLCTFGVANIALLKTLCGYDPAKFKRMDVRFSAPIYPGETIRTEIWHEAPGRAGFRCRVVERDLVVLNNGLCEFHEGD